MTDSATEFRPTLADASPTVALPIAASHSRWRDLLELVKPRMNLLILGTTAVGFYCAALDGRAWLRLPDTLIGTGLCAAGAAILNQLIERHYDARMPRTRNRPLPTGRISPAEALVLGILAGIAGGLYLLLRVNALTAILGTATLLSYVAVYTPLKRHTTLNTIVGAVPGAIPPLMGWTAVTGSLSITALPLFAILFVWQIPHFLAIATMYRDDYRAGGFKMLPVDDGDLTATSRQILIYTAALFPVSMTPVLVHLAGWPYAAAALAMDLVFGYYAVKMAQRRLRPDARKLFFASILYLPALLAVLMLDRT